MGRDNAGLTVRWSTRHERLAFSMVSECGTKWWNRGNPIVTSQRWKLANDTHKEYTTLLPAQQHLSKIILCLTLNRCVISRRCLGLGVWS
jgi:hypothetical protein